jgi:methionine-rich copper-binding protein CopC
MAAASSSRSEKEMIVRRAARILVGIAAATALLIPATVLGHAELVSSDPGAGENLDTAPTEVRITFDDELDPDASGFTVTDADGGEVGGGEVDLTVADRNVLAGEVTITDPGIYTVAYEIAGLDGHPIEGTFSFGFNSDEAIPEPTGGEDHENPDTAMPRPDLPLLVLAGALLLLSAAVLAVRRVTVR